MPLFGGCRKRFLAVNEALETATSPSLKRLRRENDGLLARVTCLEAKMNTGSEESLLLEQRVLQLTSRDGEPEQVQQFREGVQQLREKVARAEAAKTVAHAATEERSNLQMSIEEETQKADLLEMENSQLERRVAEHDAERQTLLTEKEKVEEERRSVERKLAEKTRRSMISRACFEKKLRGEREANDQLQQQLAEAVNNNEALREGSRRWEKWAYAHQHQQQQKQQQVGDMSSFASAIEAHLAAQPQQDRAQEDAEELEDVYHLGDLEGADLFEDLRAPRHRLPH